MSLPSAQSENLAYGGVATWSERNNVGLSLLVFSTHNPIPRSTSSRDLMTAQENHSLPQDFSHNANPTNRKYQAHFS